MAKCPGSKHLVNKSLLLFSLFLGACAHQSIVTPFRPAATPTVPEQVTIYRVARPTVKFTELGLITFHTNLIALPYIYDKLRTDAAAQGADSVIDVKFKGEEHMESRMVQNCTPQTFCEANGMCHTVNNCYPVVMWEKVKTYLIEGSMIRSTP